MNSLSLLWYRMESVGTVNLWTIPKEHMLLFILASYVKDYISQCYVRIWIILVHRMGGALFWHCVENRAWIHLGDIFLVFHSLLSCWCLCERTSMLSPNALLCHSMQFADENEDFHNRRACGATKGSRRTWTYQHWCLVINTQDSLIPNTHHTCSWVRCKAVLEKWVNEGWVNWMNTCGKMLLKMVAYY